MNSALVSPTPPVLPLPLNITVFYGGAESKECAEPRIGLLKNVEREQLCHFHQFTDCIIDRLDPRIGIAIGDDKLGVRVKLQELVKEILRHRHDGLHGGKQKSVVGRHLQEITRTSFTYVVICEPLVKFFSAIWLTGAVKIFDP